MVQSPQTPGVYYERVDASAPAIALLRTDIAGFVGIATRGPLHQPLPVQSWRQFQAYFGDFTGAGYLAYAVRAFFENGGQRCWVVRVAQKPAATAAVTLKSASLVGIWTISASSPGVWGNDLEIVITETHRAQTLTDPRSKRAGIFRLSLSTTGFRPRHARAPLSRARPESTKSSRRSIAVSASADLAAILKAEARLPYDRRYSSAFRCWIDPPS